MQSRASAWGSHGTRSSRKLLEMEITKLLGEGEKPPIAPHPPHPQPCSLCSRSGRRHLPRAPWQMSVRVAPPTINWGSSQISWGRDPQSAVKPRGMRFCSQDPPVPSGCTGPFSLLLSLGKALQLDGHGVLLGPPICGSRRMGRAGLGEKGSLCPTLQNA